MSAFFQNAGISPSSSTSTCSVQPGYSPSPTHDPDQDNQCFDWLIVLLMSHCGAFSSVCGPRPWHFPVSCSVQSSASWWDGPAWDALCFCLNLTIINLGSPCLGVWVGVQWRPGWWVAQWVSDLCLKVMGSKPITESINTSALDPWERALASGAAGVLADPAFSPDSLPHFYVALDQSIC